MIMSKTVEQSQFKQNKLIEKALRIARNYGFKKNKRKYYNAGNTKLLPCTSISVL